MGRERQGDAVKERKEGRGRGRNGEEWRGMERKGEEGVVGVNKGWKVQ